MTDNNQDWEKRFETAWQRMRESDKAIRPSYAKELTKNYVRTEKDRSRREAIEECIDLLGRNIENEGVKECIDVLEQLLNNQPTK